MLKIIKERTPVKMKEYTIEYRYKDDPNAGFTFPATRSGAPDFSCMSPEAKANYNACLTDNRLTGGELEVREWTYVEPAIGKCFCGKEVILDSDYMGAVMCDCGRWYNLFGQSLKDPKYWERDDDDYCFMACNEDL